MYFGTFTKCPDYGDVLILKCFDWQVSPRCTWLLIALSHTFYQAVYVYTINAFLLDLVAANSIFYCDC